jgi:hypothetical protein
VAVLDHFEVGVATDANIIFEFQKFASVATPTSK